MGISSIYELHVVNSFSTSINANCPSEGGEMAEVTMRDVAKAAGVSEATVSYVVNGHTHRVSAQTRERVLAAITTLRYTPNTIARSLASQTTWTIGLVVSDVVRTPYTSAIKGVERVAVRCGYQVILCNADDNPVRLAQAISVLAAKRVDGAVFALSSRQDEDLPLGRLVEMGIPVVIINRHPRELSIPSFLIDNASGTYQLTKQLISIGHRRIACIHLPVEGARATTAAIERLAGYKQALLDSHLPIDPAWCRTGAPGEEMGDHIGFQHATELLTHPSRPTAFVCCNDYLAFGVIRACTALGLHVPSDISVVGHDNTSASRYFQPKLTTAEQPMLEAGEQATQMLVELIREKTGRLKEGGVSSVAMPFGEATDNEEDVYRLPCQLVIRDSIGHCKE
jgi:DNA-binding LacI/PurR family transcriptional regulator